MTGRVSKLATAKAIGLVVNQAAGPNGKAVIAAGVTCPKCRNPDSCVVDSRGDMTPQGITTRRRRLCDGCGEKFTTFEVSSETSAGLFNAAKEYKADALKWRILQMQRELGE